MANLSSISLQIMGGFEFLCKSEFSWSFISLTSLKLVDERMLEMMGNLAVENMGGNTPIEWRDVGIFTSNQWTVLIGKCLGSFSE